MGWKEEEAQGWREGDGEKEANVGGIEVGGDGECVGECGNESVSSVSWGNVGVATH